MYTPTANGYFSGAGLLEIGMQQAGIKMIQSLDIDPAATACMQRNPHYFSHKVLTCDIKEKTVREQPQSDIILGTYPCNKYSNMAELHDTCTGDDLFLHFFRLIALRRPEMYVVENVPGMKKFPVVMEAMTQLPDYYVNVFCPVDAANWLPQRRKRLLLIGTRRNFMFMAPTPANIRPKLRDLLEPSPAIELPQYVLNRLKGQYRDRPIIIDPAKPGAIAPTCLAHYAKDLGTRLVKDAKAKYGVRPFTVREYARLQGVPDDYHFDNTLESYRLIGNGVPVPMGRWLGLQAMKYFN